MHRPRIVVITTGGTIASLLDPETGGVRAAATAEDLIATVPGIGDVAELELHTWATVHSWDITPAMMFDLAHEARQVLDRPDVDGVVITHGTDTVEETGLVTELLVDSEKPVVYAVAMRNLSEVSPDGPRNLLDAVKVASHPESRGRGSLLVTSEEIHSLRYVTKANTVNPHAFVSPDYGPIGLTPANGLRYLHAAPKRRVLSSTAPVEPVYLVKAVTGSDASMIDWALDQGAKGIVLEGSGAGNVPSDMVPGIQRALQAGIPIVLTSRALSGFLSATYGSGGDSGGGFDLARMGVIPAAHWPSQKARIALMLAMGAGLSDDPLREFFSAP